MQAQQTEEGSITPVELQAELDTLRSLRRRSISQPSEGIDPDLPPSPSKYTHASPPGSPIQLHHVAGPSEIPIAGPSGSNSSGSTSTLGRRTSASSRLSNNIAEEDEETPEDQPLADNLSELFWLPARLHPEIAPQEFRNFIRDQTRPENLLRRSGSHLGRRKSMLSRQYQPSDTETDFTSMFPSDADSTPGTTPSISRRPSRAGSFRRNTGLENLTLADLQKLETIARQAAEEGQTGDEGEAQLKRLVRRSLSLNPAAILGVADQLRDDDSYVEDESDSPLIVPPPGSILRRSARTKIRKNSLLGDGNGHRFGPSRRGPKGLDSAMEDDPNRPISGRRHSSISSLNSVEEEKRLSQGDRPTSAELRRLSPRSPTRSPRSPDDAPSTPEPLPIQYMPSTGAALAEQMEAADLGAQQSDRMTVSPVRAGADMPANGHVASPPLQWTLLSNPTDQKVTSPPASATSTSGSLRSTKRIGTTPPQPAAEVLPRTSSAAAQALSPPQSNQQVLPSTSESATSTQASASGSAVPAKDDSRPALPTKGAGASQQTDTKTAPSVRTPTTGQTPRAAPQQPTSKTPVQTQKAAVLSPASQTSHKVSHSPSQTSTAPKEKEKKSTWAKLGLSRTSKDEADIDDSASIASTSSGASSTFGRKGKKSKKDKSIDISPEKKQQAAGQVVSEKGDKQDASSSFFGGLFGKKKAEQNDQPKRDGSTTPTQMQMPTPPPTASGMLTPDGKYINFYRLPIHIERAVYRLSHIKLANPRRPLYEQVLISNLMFWYLGVINKPVAPPPQAQHRSVPPSQSQAQLNAPPTGNMIVPNIVPGQPVNQSTLAGAILARPGTTREHASNSGDAHLLESGRSSAGGESVFDPASNNAQRPASHPPMIAKSPPNEISEPDYNMRTRPQTMPVAQLTSNSLEIVSPPPHVEESHQYRYQDYISTSGAEATGKGVQHTLSNGMHYTEPSAADPNAGSGYAPVEQEARQTKRFSLESLETDDVRFDSRRATTDLDTYDIIAAYADEERRKSLLAQSSSGSDPEMSPNPPSLSASHRNGADLKSNAEPSQHNPMRSHSAARATPPRQSSVGAIGTQPPAHQHQRQHQAPLASSPRHASKSPSPRSHQSNQSLPTQS